MQLKILSLSQELAEQQQQQNKTKNRWNHQFLLVKNNNRYIRFQDK